MIALGRRHVGWGEGHPEERVRHDLPLHDVRLRLPLWLRRDLPVCLSKGSVASRGFFFNLKQYLICLKVQFLFISYRFP